MKKLMEFKIKTNREPATLQHFEIWADNISFKDHENIIPVCTADGILMYEFTGTGKVPYQPNRRDWYGNIITVDDAFYDILGRLTRNETEMVNIIYLDSDLENYVSLFLQRTAAEFNGRKIPYEILFKGGIAQLVLATDQFLYYLDELDFINMFRTCDGTLVSDNEFAEIGFYESEDAIGTGGEVKIDFQSYE